MNDKYYDGSDDQKELCKNIKAFVLDIMSSDARKTLVSVTWASPHHPFFGKTLKWDTGDGWRSTAIVYFYYKALKVLEKVKEYETIYSETIVINTFDFLKSVYEQLDNKEEVSLSLCDGINSNIADVPDAAIESTLRKFDQFE